MIIFKGPSTLSCLASEIYIHLITNKNSFMHLLEHIDTNMTPKGFK